MRRVSRFFILTLLVLTVSGPVAHADNIVLHNTGVTVTGTLLGTGATDPNYTLTTNSATGGNSIAYVATTPHPGSPGWVANTSNSQWINPVATNGDGTPKSVAPGPYTYVTNFSLAGFDPTTTSITGNLASDNAITDILINGFSTRATNSANYSFSSFKTFTIGSLYSADFLAGNNTLTFVLQNAAGSNSVSGLQVQMLGTATATPEPAAFMPFVIGALGLLTMIAYRRRLVN